VVDTTPPPPADTVVTQPPPPPPPPADTSTLAARAELPRSVPTFTVLAATRSYVITSGLQAALDTAKGGDEIRLSGFHGNVILPSRPCGSWVTIRSNAADSLLPKPGERPSAKHFPYMPVIRTADQSPALKTANPTCGWRLFAVEMTITYTGLNYGIVWLGDGGYADETQTTLARVPQNIILDRVYIHGNDASNTTRCLNLNSAHTILRDSYIDACHAVGFESHGVAGWNTPGGLLLENNYIDGAGINLFFGGADPAIDGLIPSDITIVRNHIRKNPAYKGRYPAKGVIELKNAQRVLYEGNVIENSWPSAQSGMCVVFKSQTGNEQGAKLWQGTTDVTFRYNRVNNCQRGLNLQAAGEGGSDRPVARVEVTNNLFTNVGTSNGIAPSDGWLMLLTHALTDVRIARNTFIGNADGYGLCGYFAYSGGAARRVEITDNICAGRSYYGLAGDGGNHAAALTAFAGSSWVFRGNVVSQVEGQFWGLSPSGNTYLTGVAAIGLRADGSSVAFPGAGADVATILARTAGVVVSP
jgi:hypothetical protein